MQCQTLPPRERVQTKCPPRPLCCIPWQASLCPCLPTCLFSSSTGFFCVWIHNARVSSVRSRWIQTPLFDRGAKNVASYTQITPRCMTNAPPRWWSRPKWFSLGPRTPRPGAGGRRQRGIRRALVGALPQVSSTASVPRTVWTEPGFELPGWSSSHLSRLSLVLSLFFACSLVRRHLFHLLLPLLHR